MANIISFDVSALGKSHEKSKLPCQDFGLSKEKDGVYIAIACDGHGSKSYVRSHIGSEIAANVAYDKITAFVMSLNPKIFLHKKAAVTAIPIENPLKDKSGGDIDMKDLSESQQEIVKQNVQYVKTANEIPEQEMLFRELFLDINKTWKIKITNDFNENPFTTEEKESLGDRDLVKAYGTTLLAFVRTPLYWFSFQIGDGKILCADRNFHWEEPVPWDYSCFLNYTTSLCDNNPVKKFRYAFDGTGNFPIAVTVSSDGIDDTFITKDSLHNFHSLLLCNFHKQGKSETVKSLKEYLPKLSEKGSRDDMTIAGIVDLDALENGVEIFEINREGNDLVKQRNGIEKELKDLEDQYTNLKEQLKELNNKIKEIENEIALNINKKGSILKELSFTQKKLEDFSDMGKGKVEKLKESRERLIEKNLKLALDDEKRWEELVAKIKIEEEKKTSANIAEKNKVESLDCKGTEVERKQTDEEIGDNVEKYQTSSNISVIEWDLSKKLLHEKSTVAYSSSSSISLMAIEDEREGNQRVVEVDESLENHEKINQDKESDKQFKEIKDKSQEEEKPTE